MAENRSKPTKQQLLLVEINAILVEHEDTTTTVSAGCTLQLKNGYGERLSGTILHSDRGCQYTSGAFREVLRSMGIIQTEWCASLL